MKGLSQNTILASLNRILDSTPTSGGYTLLPTLKKGKVSLGELPGTVSYGSEEITHIWERARSERYYVYSTD
ncbi:hypothetical protein [Paenibacillus xylanivorans]|uniref:Uncharacterized protein n=1 Tax=Paenibacillus xylanivorans TaxID=1705561 RepID=A0A0M9BQ23_9BACL|nr:hypothetical protein [Paenibacillus xylanivorans]KOY15802.1 hypothetical protein AMS66_14150 [Paenibacillus xylanivorans]